MEYEVLVSFSHKLNERRIELSKKNVITEEDIQAPILRWALANKFLKAKGIVEKAVVEGASTEVKDPKEKMKINRGSTKEASMINEVETVIPIKRSFDLSKEGLKDLSKDELKSIANQLGISKRGSEKTLINNILNSGV